MTQVWPYLFVSREKFEDRKDFVGKALQDLGCDILNIELPYEDKMTTCGLNFEETWFSQRPVYQYNGAYYRICEILFFQKPFIVLECARTLDEVMKNIMEDADPFPYDLSDADIIKELRYSLAIEPYPEI